MAAETPVPSTEAPVAPPDLKVLWTRCALFVAIVGVLGSLHLSVGMELKPCPLCYYQRAFIMSAAAILALGLFLPAIPTAAQTVLALAPSFAGLCIAATHTRLVVNGDLECPAGITDMLVAPAESLIVFTALIACLLGDLFHQRQHVTLGLCAMLLGFVLCTTSLKATPTPPERTTPYPESEKFDVCRKPYREKS